MATKSKKQKPLSEAQCGDQFVMTASSRYDGGPNRQLVEIVKVTAKQVVLRTEYRFWKEGPNAGCEVGGRSAYYQRIVRHLALTTPTADEIAQVTEEMEERGKKLAEKRDKEDEKRKAKEARREKRFEGELDRAKKQLDQISDTSLLYPVARRLSAILEKQVWDLEYNEQQIRDAVDLQRHRVDEVLRDLEHDYQTHFAPEGIQEIGERKQLIEQAKGTLYIAKAILGDDETEDQ